MGRIHRWLLPLSRSTLVGRRVHPVKSALGGTSWVTTKRAPALAKPWKVRSRAEGDPCQKWIRLARLKLM